MIKSIIGDSEFAITFDKEGSSGTLNGENFSWDLLANAPDSFHIIRNNKSYTVFVEERAEHTYTLRINGEKVVVSVKDKMDLLMEAMGISNTSSAKVKEVKAPMPGLVLRLMVEEGATVSRGDNLLVLEAMKMENIIKSPGDGTVGRIHVSMGQAVEKNQVLITMA